MRKAYIDDQILERTISTDFVRSAQDKIDSFVKGRETKTKEVRNVALALPLSPEAALSTAIPAVGMEVAIGGICSLC